MKIRKSFGFVLVPLAACLAVAAPGPGNGSADCREEVRGDGSIIVGEGRQRARFHVRGSDQSSSDSARLDFRDKNSDLRLRSRTLISYEVVDAETRRLTFDLGGGDDTNGVNTAVVILRDLGRRGRNDFFEISTAEYLASGNLRGGQVRIKQRGDGCNGVID